MPNKYLSACLAVTLLFSGTLAAQTKTGKAGAKNKKPAALSDKAVATSTAKAPGSAIDVSNIDPIKLNNQMMMVFMERMKTGNYNEAREIAEQMIFGHENFRTSPDKDYKSFHSIMEKELYSLLSSREGDSKETVWVEQPISDGFYLLAMLDFQENKHEEALANMQRAIYWNPVRSAFYCERGYMLLRNHASPNPLMAQVAYMRALELADNPEDLAGALRGLGFIYLERRQPEVALACLLVAKEYTPDDNDVADELIFISHNFPTLYNNMTLIEARQTLTRNRILGDYAPEHVQVLLRLADRLTSPNDAPRAISLLRRAHILAPKNQEVSRKLQILEKK